MTLSSINELHKQAIAQWLSEHQSIGQIQKNIEETFQLSMTYMDVKFLIADLDLDVINKPVKLDPVKDSKASESDMIHEDIEVAVRVSINAINRPGTVASGDVVFSDGMGASWSIDAMSRLSLMPNQEGYQPSPDDVQTFQIELQKAFSRKGYA